MDRSTFTKAFLAFYNLLQHTNSPPCSLCQQYPPILLADGTDLGFPVKFTTSTLLPILSNSAKTKTNTIVPFQERIYLKEKVTRELLAKFTSGIAGNMGKSDWKKLKKHLTKESSSLGIYIFISNFNLTKLIFFFFSDTLLTYLLHKQPNYETLESFHFAGVWNELFNVLSSHISTTDLIHSNVVSIIEWLYTHPGEPITTDDLQKLQMYSPIIFWLVRNHDNTWPSYACSLLQELAHTCQKPFQLLQLPPDGDMEIWI